MAARRSAARRSALLASEPAEGVRQVALGLLAEARIAAGRLVHPDDPEALHDFRVAARRLRSWLRSFKPLVNDTLRKRWRKALEEVAGATGAARDAEVMRAWLQAERGSLSPRHRRAADALLAHRAPGAGDPRAEAATEFARLAPHLEEALSQYVRRVGAARRGRFGEAWAAALRAQLEAVGAALAMAFGPEDVDPAHRARIEGKRLRYLLEPLQGLAPPARGAVVTLKALQDLLGDLHDAHVLDARLAEARALAAEDARAGFTALQRRARERRDAMYGGLARDWLGEGAWTRKLRKQVKGAIAALEMRRGRIRNRSS